MDKITKTQMKREFKYMRECLRRAEVLMSSRYDDEDGFVLRNVMCHELVAVATIYTTWFEQVIETHNKSLKQNA